MGARCQILARRTRAYYPFHKMNVHVYICAVAFVQVTEARKGIQKACFEMLSGNHSERFYFFSLQRVNIFKILKKIKIPLLITINMIPWKLEKDDLITKIIFKLDDDWHFLFFLSFLLWAGRSFDRRNAYETSLALSNLN